VFLIIFNDVKLIIFEINASDFLLFSKKNNNNAGSTAHQV